MTRWQSEDFRKSYKRMCNLIELWLRQGHTVGGSHCKDQVCCADGEKDFHHGLGVFCS